MLKNIFAERKLVYSYQMQKFSEARDALMIPHAVSGEGVQRAIGFSLNHMSLGLTHLRTESLPERVRAVLAEQKVLSDSYHKAGALSVDEQYAFSRVARELADYFNSEYYRALGLDEARAAKRSG